MRTRDERPSVRRTCLDTDRSMTRSIVIGSGQANNGSDSSDVGRLLRVTALLHLYPPTTILQLLLLLLFDGDVVVLVVVVVVVVVVAAWIVNSIVGRIRGVICTNPMTTILQMLLQT